MPFVISKPRLALVVTLAISAFLNLYRLDQIGINGIGNPYYAAAVQSMLSSNLRSMWSVAECVSTPRCRTRASSLCKREAGNE